MRAHAWKAGGRQHRPGRGGPASTTAGRARTAFTSLHDWDGKADHVNDDIIPVDVLDYLDRAARRRAARRRGARDPARLLLPPPPRRCCSLRIWDEGDPDANLDRLNAPARGAAGTRRQRPAVRRRCRDADPDRDVALRDRRARLRDAARAGADAERARTALRIALAHTVSMGSHLRFGFEATYGRDTVVMRDDNVADYPWLCFALMTVMRGIRAAGRGRRGRGRQGAARRRRSSTACPATRGRSSGSRRRRCRAARTTAARSARCSCSTATRSLEAFQRFRPTPDAYSPLAFFFNFSHNVAQGHGRRRAAARAARGR